MKVTLSAMKVLREGIWASLTGGWYFDSQQSLFVNTLHLYVWLILALVPFIIRLICCETIAALVLYSAFGGIFVLFFKLINRYLHHVLDVKHQTTAGAVGDNGISKPSSSQNGSDNTRSESTNAGAAAAERQSTEPSSSGASTRWYAASPFSEGRRMRIRRRDVRSTKRSSEPHIPVGDASVRPPHWQPPADASTSKAGESSSATDANAGLNSRLKSILEEAEENALLVHEPNALSPVLESVTSESCSHTPERARIADAARRTTAICHVHKDEPVAMLPRKGTYATEPDALAARTVAASLDDSRVNSETLKDGAEPQPAESERTAAEACSQVVPSDTTHQPAEPPPAHDGQPRAGDSASRNPLALRLLRSREFREMINDVRAIRLSRNTDTEQSDVLPESQRFVPSLDDLKLLDAEPRRITRRVTSIRATRSRLTNLQRFERLVAQSEQHPRLSARFVAAEEPPLGVGVATRAYYAGQTRCYTEGEPSNAARNLTYHSSIKHRGRRGLNRDRVRERANALLARSASLNQTRARQLAAGEQPASVPRGLLTFHRPDTGVCTREDECDGNVSSEDDPEAPPKRAASERIDVGLGATPTHTNCDGDAPNGIARCSTAALTSSASALPQITLQKRTQTTCSVSVSTVTRRPCPAGTRRALSFRETHAQFRLGAPHAAGETRRVELAPSDANTSFFALTRHGLHRRLSDRLHHLSRANKPAGVQPQPQARCTLRKTSEHRRSLNLDASAQPSTSNGNVNANATTESNDCASVSLLHDGAPETGLQRRPPRSGLVRKISTPVGSGCASGAITSSGSQSHVATAIAQSSLSLAWLYRASLDDVATPLDESPAAQPPTHIDLDLPPVHGERERVSTPELQRERDTPAEPAASSVENDLPKTSLAPAPDCACLERTAPDEEPCCKPKNLEEYNEALQTASDCSLSVQTTNVPASPCATTSAEVNSSARSRSRPTDRDGQRKVRLTTTRRRQYASSRSSTASSRPMPAPTIAAADSDACGGAALTPNSALRSNMRSRTLPGAYQRNVRSGAYQQLWNTLRQAHQRAPHREDTARPDCHQRHTDLDILLSEYDEPSSRELEDADNARRRARGVLRSPRLRRARDELHEPNSGDARSPPQAQQPTTSAASRELRTFEEIFIDLEADEVPQFDGNPDRYANGSLLRALRTATRQPRVRRVVCGDRRRMHPSTGRATARRTLHEPTDECPDAAQHDTESSDNEQESSETNAADGDGEEWHTLYPVDHELTRSSGSTICAPRMALGEEAVGAVSDSELSALESLQSALEHRRARAKTPRNYFTLNFACDLFTAKFDRLSLLALFDRDTSWLELGVAVFLSALSAGLGMAVMQAGLYYDVWQLLFCFILASSQYSLLKSVQPDACSPTHGFNRLVVYNRPIYFVFCCASILLLHHLANVAPTESTIKLYGFALFDRTMCAAVLDMVKVFTLSLPILFTVGFLPQWTTLLIYLCEQVELHVFGGSGLPNLRSGFFCMLKGLMPCAILSSVCYAGMTHGGNASQFVQSGVNGNSQSVLFSIFCALLTTFAYHFSRLPNNIDMLCEYLRHFCSRSAKQVVRSAMQKKSASMRAHFDADRHKQVAQQCCLLSFQSSSNSKRSSFEYEMDTLAGPADRSKSEVATAMGTSTVITITSASDDDVQKLPSASTYAPTAAPERPDDSKDVADELNLEPELQDPLPEQLRCTLSERIQSDLFVCPLIGVFVFALHSSTLFTVPPLYAATTYYLGGATIVLSLLNHYIFMHLRIEIPWLCFMRPCIYPKERTMFEPTQPSQLTWFERMSAYLCFAERNVLLPCLILSYVTKNAATLCKDFGALPGSIMVAVAGYRLMRGAYTQTAQQYVVLLFTYLLFHFDFKNYSQTFLLDYFLVSIVHSIVTDLLLKLQFVFAYIAPWQITWGSAFHAFAQPFSVPHSGLMYAQVLLSALFHAPIQPFLGSALFLMSYVRPLKFWERDYNTKRVDNSNTRLASQLADGPQYNAMNDDNNLNSIFYEHLSRVLQLQLAGDVQLGRFSNGQPVRAGDCFLLASDYLNALLLIVEVQNGLITFQLRGLEFRGTYCQQRELEAVNECCSKHLELETGARGAGCLFQRNTSASQTVGRSVPTGNSEAGDSAYAWVCAPFEPNPTHSLLTSNVLAPGVLTNPATSSTASLSGHVPPTLNLTGSSLPGIPPTVSAACTPRERERDRDASCNSRVQLVPAGRMWSYRFQTWRLLVQKYALETYSITDNNAATMLQMYDLRRLLITLYVKSIIFFTVRSRTVQRWLDDAQLRTQLALLAEPTATDLDPVFSVHVDEDYDIHLQGVSRKQFVNCYLEWIAYCWQQRHTDSAERRSHASLDAPGTTGVTSRSTNANSSANVSGCGTADQASSEIQITADHFIVTLCYALSLFGRRALASASHFSYSTCVEFFLFGLHELFKGDFRVANAKDEWCLNDMRFLEAVLKPAVRIALKLHQDHFTLTSDELADPRHLFTLIAQYIAPQTGVVVTHESDPRWRLAILANQPSLLALRHCMDDGQDEYKIIQLNRRVISFRVVSINRECVRGLWAGQQQELVYLRNRNSERGSIQNAKQVLRNMINASCDQPLGYPIYVSPLLTSFVNTNVHYKAAFGVLASLSWATPFRCLKALFLRCVHRCLKAFRHRGTTRTRRSRVSYAHERSQMVDEDSQSINIGTPPLSGSFPRVTYSHPSHGYLLATDAATASAKVRSSSLPMHARNAGKMNRDAQSGSTRLMNGARATNAVVHATHSQHALDTSTPRLPHDTPQPPQPFSEDAGCVSRSKSVANQSNLAV